MREALLLISAVPAGVAILISYIVVLGNVANAFPLQMNAASSTSPTSSAAGDYFASPYWLGLPRGTCIAITMLQVLAGFGYIAWFVWLLDAPASVFENSLLKTRLTKFLLVHTFLIASIAWPFAAYFYMQGKTVARAVLACAPLWIAALAVILLVGGTFEAAAPPLPTIGILLLAMIVVLADGVGWSAACIKQAQASS